MNKLFKKTNSKESILYNNILLLSRNKLFYTKFFINDTFQNRINLIFLHISFLFIKINRKKDNKKYKTFYQNMFDLTFIKIEQNMRELGYGDTVVNKNMKFLVKNFYNILLNCESYKTKSDNLKNSFFHKYLHQSNNKNKLNNVVMIPPLPFKYLRKYLENADIALISLHDYPFMRATIPARLLDYMRYSLPIVMASGQCEGREIIEGREIQYEALMLIFGMNEIFKYSNRVIND